MAFMGLFFHFTECSCLLASAHKVKYLASSILIFGLFKFKRLSNLGYKLRDSKKYNDGYFPEQFVLLQTLLCANDKLLKIKITNISNFSEHSVISSISAVRWL